jgi:tRNA-dihydrouridine synthase A
MAVTSGAASSTMKGISVAPMMKYTHRHYRYMMRLLTKRTLLYTEMRVDKALIFGQDLESMLGFHPAEHPIALQLGGNDSEHLCQAAKIGEQYGYDEINLNAGCPSDKVSGKGCFGKCGRVG